MSYSTLPNSGLRTWPYGESGWLTHFNYNFDRLTDTLLKVSGMLDVDLTGLSDGDILRWNSGTSKWEPQTPLWAAHNITTTTTSTSSTTSSSTSSTTTTNTTSSSTSSTSSSTSSSTTTSSTTTSSTTTSAAPTTEFICSVGPGQADYTTLAAFCSALPADLTLTTIKVFSGTRTGTIADGSAVTGFSSSATGTVVHCTATQICIRAISGTFQASEQIRKDVSNYFTSSNAGDPVRMVAEVATTANADTAKATAQNCITSSSSRVIVRAASGHEASTQWSTSKYRLQYTALNHGDACLTIAIRDFDLVNVQVNPRTDSLNVQGVAIIGAPASTTALIDGCLILGTVTAGTSYVMGIVINDTDATAKVRNTIVYDCKNGTNANCYGIYDVNAAATYIFNCTIHNCYTGVSGNSARTRVINTIANDCNDGFGGSYHGDSDYNCSDISSDAPGAHSRNGANGTVTFADEAGDDFALHASDSNAADQGTSLAAHGVLPVTTDIDGTDRTSGTYDVGAYERP